MSRKKYTYRILASRAGAYMEMKFTGTARAPARRAHKEFSELVASGKWSDVELIRYAIDSKAQVINNESVKQWSDES